MLTSSSSHPATQSSESSHQLVYCIHTSAPSTSFHRPAAQYRVKGHRGPPLWGGSVSSHRTERVKSPGLLLLGRARKLPWTPRVNRSCSASIPVMLGWNHLKQTQHRQTHERNLRIESLWHNIQTKMSPNSLEMRTKKTGLLYLENKRANATNEAVTSQSAPLSRKRWFPPPSPCRSNKATVLTGSFC